MKIDMKDHGMKKLAEEMKRRQSVTLAKRKGLLVNEAKDFTLPSEQSKTQSEDVGSVVSSNKGGPKQQQMLTNLISLKTSKQELKGQVNHEIMQKFIDFVTTENFSENVFQVLEKV